MIELDQDALEAAKGVWKNRWKHTQIPKLFIEDMIEMYLTIAGLKDSAEISRLYDTIKLMDIAMYGLTEIREPTSSHIEQWVKEGRKVIKPYLEKQKESEMKYDFLERLNPPIPLPPLPPLRKREYIDLFVTFVVVGIIVFGLYLSMTGIIDYFRK